MRGIETIEPSAVNDSACDVLNVSGVDFETVGESCAESVEDFAMDFFCQKTLNSSVWINCMARITHFSMCYCFPMVNLDGTNVNILSIHRRMILLILLMIRFTTTGERKFQHSLLL